MKHRCKCAVLVVLIAIVLGTGIGWCVWPRFGSRITRANYDRLQLGMAPEEVFSILGNPTGEYSSSTEGDILPRPPLLIVWIGGNKIYGHYTWTRSGDVCIAVQTRIRGDQASVISKTFYAFDYLAWTWQQK
jgi:hypothetical protein